MVLLLNFFFYGNPKQNYLDKNLVKIWGLDFSGRPRKSGLAKSRQVQRRSKTMGYTKGYTHMEAP